MPPTLIGPAPVELRFERLVTSNTPLLTVKAPVKLLAEPISVSVPGPVFVRPPLPFSAR